MMKLDYSDKLFLGKMSCLFALVLMGFVTSKNTFNNHPELQTKEVTTKSSNTSMTSSLLKKTNLLYIR
jgi:hypothetical protein